MADNFAAVSEFTPIIRSLVPAYCLDISGQQHATSLNLHMHVYAVCMYLHDDWTSMHASVLHWLITPGPHVAAAWLLATGTDGLFVPVLLLAGQRL
jgi:hypothetical protein